ncbi:unnamed protein product, partial [Closterium sp. NIES-54]
QHTPLSPSCHPSPTITASHLPSLTYHHSFSPATPHLPSLPHLLPSLTCHPSPAIPHLPSLTCHPSPTIPPLSCRPTLICYHPSPAVTASPLLSSENTFDMSAPPPPPPPPPADAAGGGGGGGAPRGGGGGPPRGGAGAAEGAEERGRGGEQRGEGEGEKEGKEYDNEEGRRSREALRRVWERSWRNDSAKAEWEREEWAEGNGGGEVWDADGGRGDEEGLGMEREERRESKVNGDGRKKGGVAAGRGSTLLV